VQNKLILSLELKAINELGDFINESLELICNDSEGFKAPTEIKELPALLASMKLRRSRLARQGNHG